jgi:uncharacterized protein YbjT (DUF2867 family)
MRIAIAGGTGTLGRLLTAALLQPITAAEVARYVAGLAEQPPRRERPEVAGPEVTELRALAHTWRSVTGRPLALLPVYLPGQAGRALRTGTLTTGQAEMHGRVSFAAWLEAGAGTAVTARGGPEHP